MEIIEHLRARGFTGEGVREVYVHDPSTAKEEIMGNRYVARFRVGDGNSLEYITPGERQLSGEAEPRRFSEMMRMLGDGELLFKEGSKPGVLHIYQSAEHRERERQALLENINRTIQDEARKMEKRKEMSKHFRDIEPREDEFTNSIEFLRRIRGQQDLPEVLAEFSRTGMDELAKDILAGS